MPSWTRRHSLIGVVPKKQEQKSLPKSLEWYLNATKLLVTLSTGAIVFGFGFFKEVSLSEPERILFAVSSLTLGFSSISGVMTFLFTTSYANKLEDIFRNGTSVQKEKTRKGRHKSLKKWYNRMLFSFISGILLFSIFGLALIFLHKKPIDQNLSVIPIQSDADRFLLSNTKNGRLWILSKDSTGIYKQEEIKIE